MLWRKSYKVYNHNTSDGLPIGLSVDYDWLTTEGDPFLSRCHACDRGFTNIGKLFYADNNQYPSHISAVLCSDCRAKGRQVRLNEAAPLPKMLLLKDKNK